ncbi:permease [Pontibacillus sp. ALD_SL1]|uniref:permease n=1 Tax=Pontibacillus sp. ALD_SL1 TaxID=2777185 RepID=UPI001A963C88|nr:permease [Pontibacillus sp. ALD_SL1]QST01328.1 permease [Pontibacillus sp. ALD_SL1]
MISQKFSTLIGYILLLLFFTLFLFGDLFPIPERFSPSENILNVNTIFLSIVLEAIPFILLGVFVSSLIQLFVKEEHLNRFIPRNPILALAPAVAIGVIFPVCECAIVPIVRRLIAKGMPMHVGMVVLVSAPVLNPIVYLSTYHAFQSTPSIAYARMGLAFVIALLIGLLMYLLYERANPLKENKSKVEHHHHSRNRFKEMFDHASDEFFDMGKFLIIGAFLAALVQTFMDRDTLAAIGNGVYTGPAAMMGMAYILSLCSEADAFVASSFQSFATPASLLAFLVYGPMIDLKNTILLFAYFRARFVASLVFVITLTTFSIIMIYQNFF